MKKFLFAAVSAVALAGPAMAAVVDFEDLGPLDTGRVDMGSTFTHGGITFSSDKGIYAVGVDVIGIDAFLNPFYGPDTPTVAGSLGEVFLSNDFWDGLLDDKGDANMVMSFAAPQSAISFDIADIDGTLLLKETFTVDYYLGTTLAGSQSVTSPGLAGSGRLTNFAFSGMFDRVEINGTVPGVKNIGWGLDNIETSPVPVPMPAVLLAGGLGALGLMRHTRRNKA